MPVGCGLALTFFLLFHLCLLLTWPQCAVRRGLGLGREALGLCSSSFAGLPMLRTASRTLARPFARMLGFRAATMLMTSFGVLPSEATSI